MLTARPNRTPKILTAAFGALASLIGCAHIGPRTIPVDRFDYSSAIADSWKQQTLLNIVKMRYMDLPVFVDVSSIVSGYSLQTGVNVTGTLSTESAIQGNFGAAGVQAVYTDRPTITYVPLTGEKFLRGLLTPIEPKNIFFMLQSGYAADFILALTVESLNGVRNRSTAGGVVHAADPEFQRALELMREVQAAGAMGIRVEEDKGKGSNTVLFFRRDDVAPEVVAKSAEIRRLLRVSPDQTKFVLVFSPVRGGEGELAVNSRSMLQILGAFASLVEVPAAHAKEHGAGPAVDDSNLPGQAPSVRVRCGKDKPASSFVAVRYRDHWFWIEDDDWQTKRALTAVMFFFTLADTGANDKLPLITIPAQ